MENSKKEVKIYGLYDPRTSDDLIMTSLRYVGMTTQTLKQRYWCHISGMNRVLNKQVKKATYRDNWLISLHREGLRPKIILLDEVIGLDNGYNLEILWIKRCKECGCKLTNLSEGGCGVTGDYVSKKTNRRFKKRNHTSCRSRKIYQFTLEGKLINVFDSIRQACLHLKKGSAGIYAVLSGKIVSAYGFLWSFEDSPLKTNKMSKNTSGYNQYSKNNEFIKFWRTAKEASLELKINHAEICECAKNPSRKTAGGFIWKLAK